MLIDTNVWGELTRPRPDRLVLGFIAAQARRLYLSTIVLAEIEYGVAHARDPVRRERLAAFRDDAIARCDGRILAPDNSVAAIWGQLKSKLETAGQPIADIDLLIAAQAIAADMPLVTRNVSDMERTGAVVIDPWLTASAA